MVKKKHGSKIILAAFLLVICLPWLFWFFLEQYVDTENHENRKTNDRPVLMLENYAAFADEYESYYNDHIPFRNLLIGLNNKIDFFMFHKSSSDNVIIGEDGWLFYTPTLNDYKKSNLYTPEQLEEIKEQAVFAKQYFDGLGIEFVLFIAPNKASVYGDYMPDYIEVNDGASRTEQAVAYLRENTDLTIIYPKEELENARALYPELNLYYKLDTHWNAMGAYFGTQPLLDALGLETADFEQISYEAVNRSAGDLANMLNLADVLNKDTDYSLSGYSDNSVSYDAEFDGSTGRTSSDSPEQKKVFLLRDSFGGAMTPYLAAAFSEVYSVHRGAITKSQITEEKPDLFIYEIVERDFNGLNVQGWED